MSWIDRHKHNPLLLCAAAFLTAMVLEVAAPAVTDLLNDLLRGDAVTWTEP